MRILVAEPSAIISWTYESLLQDHGHVVIGPAQAAQDALRLAVTAAPLHLALAEVDLADGDWTGLHLAQELRDRWGIPTFFFTTRDAHELPQEKYALGLLQKPVISAALIASVGVAEALIAGLPIPAYRPSGLTLFR